MAIGTPQNPASNTQILQDLYYVVIPRLEKKIDAITTTGQSPKDAIKAAIKEIVNGG